MRIYSLVEMPTQAYIIWKLLTSIREEGLEPA